MNGRLTRRRLLRTTTVPVTILLAGCSKIGAVTVHNASVDRSDVYAGDEVAVEAVVKNTGISSDDARVNVSVDGTVVDETMVEVGARGRKTVTLTHRFDEPGTHSLAVNGVTAGTVTVKPVVSVAAASLRESTVNLGEAVRIDATVRNRGETQENASLVLRADGSSVGQKEITVPADAETDLTLQFCPAAAGTYDVTVNDTALGTLTVADAWQQFGYDSANTGHDDGATMPSERPSREWSAWLGEGSRSSPVASGDTVFVGVGNPYGASDVGAIAAFRSHDGKARWRTETEGPVFGSPALAGGRVIVGTTDGALRDVESYRDLGGHISAYSMDDGTNVWSRSVESPVLGSPTVDGDVLYVTVAGGTVLALDAVDGHQRWQRSVAGPGYLTPAVADDTLFVGGSGGTLRALDTADGSERWQYDAGGMIWNSPTVADDTVYVGGGSRSIESSGSTLHAVSVADGTGRWRRKLDGVMSGSFAVDDDGLYASVGISVWGIDREDGRVRWRGPDARAGASGGSPAVVDGTVYAGVGRVNGGLIFAFDTESGDVEWQHEVDAGGSSPAVHDGTVYATVGFGNLLALR